jgi:hypothetical protein
MSETVLESKSKAMEKSRSSIDLLLTDVHKLSAKVVGNIKHRSCGTLSGMEAGFQFFTLAMGFTFEIFQNFRKSDFVSTVTYFSAAIASLVSRDQ